MAAIEGRLFGLDVYKEYYCGGVFSEWVNLAYNRILILIILFTIIEDMIPSFNRITATWTLEIFFGKESQPVFANRSMIYYSSSHSCT